MTEKILREKLTKENGIEFLKDLGFEISSGPEGLVMAYHEGMLHFINTQGTWKYGLLSPSKPLETKGDIYRICQKHGVPK